MPHVYAYTRCSHRTSKESGAGLAAQDTRVAEMYESALDNDSSLRWAIDSYDNERPGHFTDKVVSAFRVPIFKRPAGSALMAKLQKGDLLLVSAVDRMFRSVGDMAHTVQWLDQRGVRVQFGNAPIDTSTPLGRMFLQQMVCFAEWESAIKGLRSQEAIAIRDAAKAAGKPVDSNLLSPSNSQKPSVLRRKEGLRQQFDPKILEFLHPDMEEKPQGMVPGRIFVSLRCSHLDSVESGLGIEWQRRTCMRKVEHLMERYPQLTFGGEFVDEAVSAWKNVLEKRPEAGRMAKMLRPGDHVLFARLDRAFRSVRDMSNTLPRWQDNGVSVCFVADGIDSRTVWGRAAIGMLAIFAEIEPELTSARTKDALRELRSHGLGIARIWGFEWKKVDGYDQLVPSRETMSLIRLSHWYSTRMKMGKERVAQRIEEILAKRQGRRPLPITGISPSMASKWFGPGVDVKKLVSGVLRHSATGKERIRLILPDFLPAHAIRARHRWPLLNQYREQKRRDAREARESRRCESSSESSAV